MIEVRDLKKFSGNKLFNSLSNLCYEDQYRVLCDIIEFKRLLDEGIAYEDIRFLYELDKKVYINKLKGKENTSDSLYRMYLDEIMPSNINSTKDLVIKATALDIAYDLYRTQQLIDSARLVKEYEKQ